MVMVREGFMQIANNTFGSLGFAPEAPVVFEWPQAIVFPNSDLTPINENLDKIVFGLTKWAPKTTAKGTFSPPMVNVQGKDYADAVSKMNTLFLRNMWGDGLPLLPATKENVDWILTGSDLPRNQVVGKILPRGGVATVEQIAVSLAMAGGRPEYLPVLIGIVEALIDPATRLASMQATTNAVFPVMIVNGPVGQQIRLNSGYGLLGPDPNHPAGASLGRAVRLLLQDAGGAIPGSGTMSINGAPGRYTGLVFAEDEAGMPKGWPTLSVELGKPAGSNTVTVIQVSGDLDVGDTEVTDETNQYTCLLKIAAHMRSYSGQNPYGSPGSAGVVVIGRRVAQGLADFGWTKEKVKSYLWEKSAQPWSEIKALSKADDLEAWMEAGLGKTDNQPTPITNDAKYINVVVAGGSEAGHGVWMPPFGNRPRTIKNITLPAKWNDLLKQAESELGPLPAPMAD